MRPRHVADEGERKNAGPRPFSVNVQQTEVVPQEDEPASALQQARAPQPSGLGPANVLALQRTAGNQAVRRLLSRESKQAAENTAGAATSPAASRGIEQFDTEVVRPTLHPPTKSQAQREYPEPAQSVMASKSASESLGQHLDPVETEDEKTNFLTASTPILNDLTPTGSSGLTTIKLSDVAIQGEVYDDGGKWKI
jgi:hypothetical protein